MKKFTLMLLLVIGFCSRAVRAAVAPSPITTQCCQIKIAGAEEIDPFYKEHCLPTDLTVEQCRDFLRPRTHRFGN